MGSICVITLPLILLPEHLYSFCCKFDEAKIRMFHILVGKSLMTMRDALSTTLWDGGYVHSLLLLFSIILLTLLFTLHGQLKSFSLCHRGLFFSSPHLEVRRVKTLAGNNRRF